ncbi:translation initiation factor IF-2 [Candidatus Falkowbacteria bacterium]|nr:MAG: translation initiation factor IF-2 [Candidatus Falkowbacteria bacterium]
MNITELARLLRITPQELRDCLPQLGFDIGQKAIKINRSEANKIIKNWSKYRNKIAELKKSKEEEEESLEKEKITEKKIITIPQYITVKELANLAGVPINAVLAELMKNGIFGSLNEKIDHETAWLIGSELNLDIKLKNEEGKEIINEENKLKKVLDSENKEDLLPRPPVIVVMGHVDHGKTKLLDAIRRTHIVDEEAGGITQHIGAYQVTRRKQLITFIDTPGHEAFTAMRSRGAKIADIAILVVAADDGVKPQTVEAFKIIKAAKIPFVVAINKIDKSGADIEKTKQELSNKLKIMLEDWGGKIICVPISALKGTGIDDLLDMVLLTAETEAKDIKANPNTSAIGTIIESNIDKGAGAVATLLIQNGTLNTGDMLLFNKMNIGKVRSLYNYRGEKITSAKPAAPVQIIGLKTMPQVGDIIQVGKGEKIKYKKIKSMTKITEAIKTEKEIKEEENIKKINIIIKSDVFGSAEAIEESLEKINIPEVKIKIIHKGLGNITDGDIKRAEASTAKIIGFNVKTPPVIEELSREKNITIIHYNIIYDLINDMKKEISLLVEPKTKKVDLGKLKVLAIFRTEKDSQILGGKIISGLAETDAEIEIFREKELIGKGKITKLQSGKQDVNSAEEGQECGLRCEGKEIIKEGDIIKISKEKIV